MGAPNQDDLTEEGIEMNNQESTTVSRVWLLVLVIWNGKDIKILLFVRNKRKPGSLACIKIISLSAVSQQTVRIFRCLYSVGLFCLSSKIKNIVAEKS